MAELQSNHELFLSAAKAGGPQVHLTRCRSYLHRLGITQQHLSNLKIIHVSGTKGKGSVCAFAESILRHSGYKTGLFSSPHLIEVVERIKIDGKPVAYDVFGDVFIKVYDCLWRERSDDSDMPAFFHMLFVVAIQLFIQLKVDVAVIEVGLGGTYDPTNVVEEPVVCGVTALDFDHQHILGNTIEEIAWNKAGIFKRNVPAFTANQIHKAALEKLHSCARDIPVELKSVDSNHISKTFPGFCDVNLGLEGQHQLENAALATKLCSTWMERVRNSRLSFENLKLGLQNVYWPGRCQTLTISQNLVFYLDGAHTCLSLQLCKNWFDTKVSVSLRGPEEVNKSQEKDEASSNIRKVLICSFTNQRKDEELIRSLEGGIEFDDVIFSDMTIFKLPTLASPVESHKEASPRVLSNRDTWANTHRNCNVQVSPSIEDSLKMAVRIAEDASVRGKKTCVLVTGSLYLVGGFLKLLNDFRTEA